MSELRFVSAVFTGKNEAHAKNEDNFSLLGEIFHPEEQEGEKLFKSKAMRDGVVAVFDGAGDGNYGEAGSMIAASTLAAFAQSMLTLEPEPIQDFVAEANARICKKAAALGNRLGSTMALLAFRAGACTGGNVGNSRIYILRDGELMQLSQEQTAAGQLVEAGALTPEAARTDKRRHQLTQYLGIPAEKREVQPAVIPVFDLEDGDRFLLCSDGITEALSDKDLCALLSQDTTCETMASNIVQSARLAGSGDDMTAMVVRVLRPAPSKPQASSRAAGASAPQKKKSIGGKLSLQTILWGAAGLVAFILGILAAR